MGLYLVAGNSWYCPDMPDDGVSPAQGNLSICYPNIRAIFHGMGMDCVNMPSLETISSTVPTKPVGHDFS